jgi:hypothetical protein
MRAGVVHGIPATVVRSKAGTDERCTLAMRKRPLRPRGTVPCGSIGGRHTPLSAAVVRCEATVPDGPARHATMAYRCQVGDEAATT